MTDPTPQAEQCLHCSEAIEKGVGGLWYSARSGSACYENRGQGGHTPAKPSPAPQAQPILCGEVFSDLHGGCARPKGHEGGHETANGLGWISTTPAPQGRIPERWKITYSQEGLSELARCIRQLGLAEWERDYWKQNAEYSARSGPRVETVVQLREERDRAIQQRDQYLEERQAATQDYMAAIKERDLAQDALRQAIPILKHFARRNSIWHDFTGRAQDPGGVHALLAALKPVSDRQPEGETK